MQDRKKRGFILIELIVVLLLITIIMGIVTVFFANFLPSSKFDATVRTIASTIKHARALSKINNETKIITIDIDSRRFGIEGIGSKDIPQGIGIKIIDPYYGEIVHGKYRFIVYNTGNIDAGDIILWNSSKSSTIRIDPIIGAVVIKQNEKS
ncbi:MAG: prepilin-type N-terminal cleavage/methylation domain-containing protein [Nitrospirae bacterium]|jgi:hypothetical protein|nr:prepilin-type N-terminal cleavage/methylation domain-containing protein [Nitrospirota bacterium]